MDEKEINKKLEEIYRSMTRILGHRGFYMLEGEEVIECPDLLTWGLWMETHYQDRILKNTQIRESRVSTVFLGLDHAIRDETPELFETMVFGGQHNLYMKRYATYAQALEGHEKVCAMVVED